MKLNFVGYVGFFLGLVLKVRAMAHCKALRLRVVSYKHLRCACESLSAFLAL